MSTISTSMATLYLFDSFCSQDETEFFLGFPEKMYNTRKTSLEEDCLPLAPLTSPAGGQCAPVVSGVGFSTLQFKALCPFLKHLLQTCENLHL